MTIKIWKAPQVSLLSVPKFFEPAHMPVNFKGASTAGERLVEFSGRMCYMSQKNESGRSNEEYLDNVMSGGHGSVLEHANYSVLIEGVSRTLTHELIRHRAGMAYSELSQRFVNMEDASFVLPPAFIGDDFLEGVFQLHCEQALGTYDAATEHLIRCYKRDGYLAHDPTLRRKRAREAARSVLPNGTETKIVATGNARAWRHILALRGSVHADAEITRLAHTVFDRLVAVAPNIFGDFKQDAEGSLVPAFPKV